MAKEKIPPNANSEDGSGVTNPIALTGLKLLNASGQVAEASVFVKTIFAMGLDNPLNDHAQGLAFRLFASVSLSPVGDVAVPITRLPESYAFT